MGYYLIVASVFFGIGYSFTAMRWEMREAGLLDQAAYALLFGVFWPLYLAKIVVYGMVAGLINRMLRKWDWFNYRWFYMIDWVQFYIVRDKALRNRNEDQIKTLVRKFNHASHRTSLKNKAPFRRDLVAAIVKHSRRKLYAR